MKILREMQGADIDAVVELIRSHDEDDAEEAEPGYRAIGGTYDQFVLEHEGRVIGVTGYSMPPGCDRTYWLSWTYIHDEHIGMGHGRRMMTELIAHVKELDGRKMFIKVSDYEDPEDGKIYAAALHLYQSMGFSLELTLNDFYDVSEAQMILGMRLQPEENKDVEDEHVPVQFNSVFEISETDGAYSFGWREDGDSIFTAEDVQIGLEQVKADGARAVYITFPENFSGVREPLLQSGFVEAGSLQDYYEDGIHEQHYIYKFPLH